MQIINHKNLLFAAAAQLQGVLAFNPNIVCFPTKWLLLLC